MPLCLENYVEVFDDGVGQEHFGHFFDLFAGYLVGYFDFEAFPLANIGDAFDAYAS